MRAYTLLLLSAAAVVLGGCVTYARPRTTVVRRPPTPVERPTPAVPAAPRDEALYDGRTGRPVTLDDFTGRAADADLVVFGEIHDDAVAARYEKELLETLGSGDRPVALAMEFLEADQQKALDAYLAGDLDRDAFIKQTHRGPTYARMHGPLIEWAKEHGAPVIAANAPRHLVSDYRKYDGPYSKFLASLSEEERSWLPKRTSTPENEYWHHFEKLMGEGEMSAKFFRAQSLWDDAMAESIADFREEHPDARVMLVVGGFHVQSGMGTVAKYRARRPSDRVLILEMQADDDPSLPFTADDRGTGDAVLKVPPPTTNRPAGPNPHARPKNPHEKPPDVQP